MDAPFTDDRGYDFVPGDIVLQGHWLQRTRRTHHLRFHKEPGLATAHAHSVRKVDVSVEQIDNTEVDSEDEEDLPFMERNRVVYSITESTHEGIVDSVVTQRRI